jgi:hypothetical protein
VCALSCTVTLSAKYCITRCPINRYIGTSILLFQDNVRYCAQFEYVHTSSKLTPTFGRHYSFIPPLLSALFVNTILARQLLTCLQYVGIQVMECLNCHYPNCMIDVFDPQAWPARSPNLMPLDYAFLGPQWQQDVDVDKLLRRTTKSLNRVLRQIWNCTKSNRFLTDIILLWYWSYNFLSCRQYNTRVL